MKKNAKVVHLTSGHWVTDVRVFQKECKSLARAGYETVLVLPHDHDDVIDGVRVHALPRVHGRWRRVTISPWRLYREALRQDGDIYHFHDAELLPVGLLLKLHGKRVIYDAHEDIPRTFLSKHYVHPWLRTTVARVSEWFENFVARRLDGIVAATPVIGERFVRINRNTAVVNNYPMLEEIMPAAMPAWEERQNRVAYLGSITPDRGVCEFVDAMPMVPGELHARVALAGIFNVQSFLGDLQQRSGWQHVDWLGYLRREQVTKLLTRVRAGIVTLRPEPAFLDCQPVKLYEYMAAGVPVIASDFPRWRPVLEDCGVLVPPGDPAAIAEAIAFLLTHPAEAEAMGRRGRARVQQLYNWNSEERVLLQLYESLLGSTAAETTAPARKHEVLVQRDVG